MSISRLARLLGLTALLLSTQAAMGASEIAYLRLTDGFWQVWITDAEGKRHRQVTEGDIDKTRVSWSPDRKALLLNRNDGTLVRALLDTKKQYAVALPVQGMLDAQWSPDGRWIAFSMVSNSKMNNLWRVKSDGSELQKLTNQPQLQLTPAWGPKGRQLAYTAGAPIEKHEIWRLDLGTHTQLTMTTPGTGYKFNPAIGPDGAIAYSANIDGDYDLWMLPQGAKQPRQLTHEPVYEGEPSWSPDGEQLAYISLQGGKRRLWIMDHATGQSQAITPASARVRAPAWFR